MGVERAVTRWYAWHQVIQQEVDGLQARCEQSQAMADASHAAELAQLELQLTDATGRLRALGPCPKPMMG